MKMMRTVVTSATWTAEEVTEGFSGSDDDDINYDDSGGVGLAAMMFMMKMTISAT